MIKFPNIQPEIFSIDIFGFSFSLRWYAVSYIVGFWVAIVMMKAAIRRSYLWPEKTPPMSVNQAESLLTYLIIGVILGGRFGYVLFYNLEYYLKNPFDIVKVWDGGMAFHGGFVGVVLSALLFSFINNLRLLSTADLIALASPPGLFFGRVANFINNELWGRPTEMPWGVVFPGNRAQDCPGIVGLCARHPSQLYEALLEGVFLLALLLLFVRLKFFKKQGFIMGAFIFGYGCSRFIVEYFRIPDPQFFSPENTMGYAFQFSNTGITMGQFLSIPMIIVGAGIIIFSLRKKARLV